LKYGISLAVLFAVGILSAYFLMLTCTGVPEYSDDPVAGESAEQIADSPVLIIGTGTLGKQEIISFIRDVNTAISSSELDLIVSSYIDESKAEGINHNLAVAQMILETGFLRFGGLVQPEQNNFAGIGATGLGNSGHSFNGIEEGVRAHIQHLKAYASTAPLHYACVDPRFGKVSRGSARSAADLAGKWAMDPEYGLKLENLIKRMKNYNRLIP